MKNIILTYLGGGMGGMMGGGGKSGGGGMGGGIAQLIGAAAGLTMGIAKKASSARLNKKADAAFPAFSDPSETSLLADVQRKKNSLNTGSAYSSMKNTLENTVSGAAASAANLAGSGGNSVKALIDSSNNVDEGFNKLLGTEEQASQFFYGLDDKLTEKGADRMLQLQMVKNRDLKAQATSDNKMAGEMIGGSFASFGGQESPKSDNASTTQGNTLVPATKSMMSGTGGSSLLSDDLGKGGVKLRKKNSPAGGSTSSMKMPTGM